MGHDFNYAFNASTVRLGCCKRLNQFYIRSLCCRRPRPRQRLQHHRASCNGGHCTVFGWGRLVDLANTAMGTSFSSLFVDGVPLGQSDAVAVAVAIFLVGLPAGLAPKILGGYPGIAFGQSVYSRRQPMQSHFNRRFGLFSCRPCGASCHSFRGARGCQICSVCVWIVGVFVPQALVITPNGAHQRERSSQNDADRKRVFLCCK